MGKKTSEKETFQCPVKQFIDALDGIFDKQSAFYRHLTNSRVEFLKAVRCLIDDRIAHLEKKDANTDRKKSTKIKVE